jgi:hypothetical protein
MIYFVHQNKQPLKKGARPSAEHKFNNLTLHQMSSSVKMCEHDQY